MIHTEKNVIISVQKQGYIKIQIKMLKVFPTEFKNFSQYSCILLNSYLKKKKWTKTENQREKSFSSLTANTQTFKPCPTMAYQTKILISTLVPANLIEQF